MSVATQMDIQMTQDGIGARGACNRVGRTSTSREAVPFEGGRIVLIRISLVRDGNLTLDNVPPAQTSPAVTASAASVHAPAAQLVAIAPQLGRAPSCLALEPWPFHS